MLNCGEGFTDIFEREAMTRADKLNTQSRYKDWLHNVKVSTTRTRSNWIYNVKIIVTKRVQGQVLECQG